MSNSGRPRSPHLTIYRWPISMLLSIMHRASGIAMAVGLLVFAAWLVRAADGPEQYQYFRAIMSQPISIAMLIGWTFAFFLHFGNGIRHLVQDNGRGLETRQATASAWFVLSFAVAMTAVFWIAKL